MRCAIDEALRCKKEGKAETILFNLSGHGHFDMQAYINYFDGKLVDQNYDENELAMALAGCRALRRTCRGAGRTARGKHMIEPYNAVGLIPSFWGIRRREEIKHNIEHLKGLTKAAFWLSNLDIPVQAAGDPGRRA